MDARSRKRHCGFQPPFRGSQSPEASPQAGTVNVLGKDGAATSERESCPEPHTGAAAGVFELAAACTTTNSDNETHNNDQGAKAIQSLSNSPLSKTSGVLGSEAKDLQSVRSKGGSSTSHSTTASTAKRLATTLHARPLRCPSKLLTHKLAISHRPKTSTILGQIGKNAGPCHLAGVLSLGGGEDARVAEPSVYDLPPTQPEVATEEHMKKAASSKRKMVLTHEQRLVHKEVLMSFERLCAEIEQIREKYGEVLNDVYTKQTVSTTDANEVWFECNEE